MEIIHTFEQSLEIIVELLKLSLETISIFCILMGLVRTGQLIFSRSFRAEYPVGFSPFIAIRLRFGIWLALALEFQLGADILATIIAPSFESLGKLGVLALIRTFLNYFLNRELTEEYEFQNRVRATEDEQKAKE